MEKPKTANKRKPIEAERDRLLIAELYLHGLQQIKIVEVINARYCPEGTELKEGGVRYTLSQQSISRDILIMQQRWMQSSLINFNQAKANEIAKIDELEREAWIAWKRSIGEHRTETKEEMPRRKKRSADAPSGMVQAMRVVKSVTKTETLNGDPHYHDTIKWCIDRRSKLLGLDEPLKLSLVDERVPAAMREEDIVDEITKILNDGRIPVERKN